MTPEKKGVQIENIQQPIVYYPAKNNWLPINFVIII